MESDEIVKIRIEKVIPFLNELQRRVYLGAEAQSIGRGGTTKIAQLSSVSRRTIAKGAAELFITEKGAAKTRTRREGGGRKKIIEHQPDLLQAIENIVSPHTMGNPMNPLIWTSKSIRKIAAELLIMGYDVCHEVVRQCLIYMGYSLQANKKTKEGGDSPDRDAQFEFINELSKEFMFCSDPVISVDCKKKELIGEYKNNGQEWTPVKNPTEVNVYDFIDKANGKASPYGVYDVQNNRGWVNVGISSDTAAFAVSTIRDWWDQEGKIFYPNSVRLFINADGGGSNGSRNNLWKAELQQFSNDSGLSISVSHFPPGTSKWNKIEHRLFSFISLNWRGVPLESYETVVQLIGAVKTNKGLVVKSRLDENIYEKGKIVSKIEMDNLDIQKHDFHEEWNYTIRPIL